MADVVLFVFAILVPRKSKTTRQLLFKLTVITPIVCTVCGALPLGWDENTITTVKRQQSAEGVCLCHTTFVFD